MNGKQLTATVWQHAPSRYGGTALLVLLKLAGLSAKDGHSFASVGYLAAACGGSPRAIRLVLKELRKDGMVKVHQRKGHSNKIFVNWDAMQALPLALPQNEAQEEAPETEQQEAAEPVKQEAPPHQVPQPAEVSYMLQNLKASSREAMTALLSDPHTRLTEGNCVLTVTVNGLADKRLVKVFHMGGKWVVLDAESERGIDFGKAA